MSRLGTWNPTTPEERLDRLESLASIRQLPHRYGMCLDSRNLDEMVDLFVPDVQVGREERGREALHRWFTESFRQFRTSIHFVGNHVVNFDDADHAHGIVYCHDEIDHRDTGEWDQGMLQYWDTYVRVDGEWYFERRRFHRWYIVDALIRPSHGAGAQGNNRTLTTHQLPEAYPSWGAFWDRVGASDG